MEEEGVVGEKLWLMEVVEAEAEVEVVEVEVEEGGRLDLRESYQLLRELRALRVDRQRHRGLWVCQHMPSVSRGRRGSHPHVLERMVDFYWLNHPRPCPLVEQPTKH